MKKLLMLVLAIFFFAPNVGLCDDITMRWSKDPVESDLAGFNVYTTGDLEAGFTLHDTISDPNARTCTHTDVNEPRWWYVTAFDTSNNESDPSNIIDNVAPGPVIVVREITQP